MDGDNNTTFRGSSEVETDNDRRHFGALLGRDVVQYLKYDCPFEVTFASVFREFEAVGLRPTVGMLRAVIADETRAAYGPDYPL